MSFEQEIDEWINLDNEIKRVSEHITKLKERKSNLQHKIISYAKQTKTEKIKYVVTNSFQPLTFTYINRIIWHMLWLTYLIDALLSNLLLQLYIFCNIHQYSL